MEAFHIIKELDNLEDRINRKINKTNSRPGHLGIKASFPEACSWKDSKRKRLCVC